MLLIASLVAVGGAFGVSRAADERSAEVERINGLDMILTSVPDDGPAENYLLVGSDSRDGANPDDPDFGSMGDAGDVGGRRSDTIMVLRRERDGGAALMSLPRDLWVEIAGTGEKNRINSAYNGGPELLASTVSEGLGIPIHHYVEVDFFGFKEIVDEIGGVEVCIDYATRDRNTGLDLQPGCPVLDGVQALAYARSRHYEEFRDGEWRKDGSADLGRIARQQLFMRAAITGALLDLRSSPFGSSATIRAVARSVRVDAGLDPIKAGDALRRAAEEGLTSFTLPVTPTDINGNSVVVLADGAEAYLDYFRGVGPAPEPSS